MNQKRDHHCSSFNLLHDRPYMEQYKVSKSCTVRHPENVTDARQIPCTAKITNEDALIFLVPQLCAQRSVVNELELVVMINQKKIRFGQSMRITFLSNSIAEIPSLSKYSSKCLSAHLISTYCYEMLKCNCRKVTIT